MRAFGTCARVVLLLALVATGCGDAALDEARASYRARRDLESLAFIQTHLAQGMPRSRVLDLLGPPDASPGPGLEQYASSHSDEAGNTIGLEIDYRLPDQTLSDRVQQSRIGPLLTEPARRQPRA